MCCQATSPRACEIPNPVVRHTVVLPVPATPNRAALKALEYAISISKDVIAVHVRTGNLEREAVLARWRKLLGGIPLVVLESPNISVLRPLLGFIDEIRDLRGINKVTVILPWLVPMKSWQKPLHNRLSAALREALRSRTRILVTVVPFRLSSSDKKAWRDVGTRTNS